MVMCAASVRERASFDFTGPYSLGMDPDLDTRCLHDFLVLILGQPQADADNTRQLGTKMGSRRRTPKSYAMRIAQGLGGPWATRTVPVSTVRTYT